MVCNVKKWFERHASGLKSLEREFPFPDLCWVKCVCRTGGGIRSRAWGTCRALTTEWEQRLGEERGERVTLWGHRWIPMEGTTASAELHYRNCCWGLWAEVYTRLNLPPPHILPQSSMHKKVEAQTSAERGASSLLSLRGLLKAGFPLGEMDLKDVFEKHQDSHRRQW